MSPNDPIILLVKQAIKQRNTELDYAMQAGNAIADLIYAAIMIHKLIMAGAHAEEAKLAFMDAIGICYDDVKLKEEVLAKFSAKRELSN